MVVLLRSGVTTRLSPCCTNNGRIVVAELLLGQVLALEEVAAALRIVVLVDPAPPVVAVLIGYNEEEIGASGIMPEGSGNEGTIRPPTTCEVHCCKGAGSTSGSGMASCCCTDPIHQQSRGSAM